jgi:protease I
MYLDDPIANKIIREFNESGKIVAAICFAPLILAHAGILNGKKATMWSGGKDDLEAHSAVYMGGAVEVDDNIITGSGPSAAKEFGEKIVEVLKQNWK